MTFLTSLRFIEEGTLVKCSEGLKTEMFSVVVRFAVPDDFVIHESESLTDIIDKLEKLKVTKTDDYIEFELLFISDNKIDAIGVAYCHWRTLKLFEKCFDDWINVEQS